MTWRTPITLLVLLVVLLGAAYYGWQTIISPATDGGTTPVTVKPACTDRHQFRKGQRIRSRNVVVNVYNAGGIGGLAADTLATMTKRGFKKGVADNVSGIGASNVTILTDGNASPQIRLVANQFKGKVKLVKGARMAPGIDVVVGDSFHGIDKTAARSLLLRHDVSTCTRTGGSHSGRA